MSSAAGKSVALEVVRVLRRAGFQAFFAGGCVRDMLLGIRSTDYDVATDATPDQVKKLFGHVLLVGAQFGVAMVIIDRRRVEVTTFRSEDSYTDGRRPDSVRFTTAQEDALRRDFTINGMFCDPITGEVIDYVGGREDLDRKIIRTIGNADERFSEDHLRMVRAVRFSVRLDFEIEPATAEAIGRNAAKIVGISGERIFEELSKMLQRKSAASALAKLHELGLAIHILSELMVAEGLWPRAVARVGAVAKRLDLTINLAALLAELDQEQITAILRRWGASNQLRDDLCFMAKNLELWATAAKIGLSDFKRLMANRNYERLALLWKVQERANTGGIKFAPRIAARARSIRPELVSPEPFITGSDLKAIGAQEGPELGHILRTIYEAQLNETIRTRKKALALAIHMLKGA